MSKIIVDQIDFDDKKVLIPVEELKHRVVKTYSATYTGGAWNPNNTFNWVPGMNYDYTPLLSNSKIRATCYIPSAGINSSHAISHWIFYANGVEIGRHCISGEHYEGFGSYTWEVDSWGAGVLGRIGYQMRSYANDNHEVRPFTTRYWDGGGSNQNSYGQFIIEEYFRG